MSSEDLKEKEKDSSGIQPDWLSRSAEPETGKEIANLEDNFRAPSATSDNLPDTHPDKPNLKAKEKKRGINKKGILFALLAGLVGGGGFFMVGMFRGPLELMHLSQILDRTNRPTESMVRTRTGSLFRNARATQTGDIGQARVGRIGNRVFVNAQAQLQNIGVEFTERSSRTGRPADMRINLNRHPNFNQLPESQWRSAVSKHYGIDINRISSIDGTGRVTVDLRGYGTGATRALVDTSLRPLEDGKIKTAMNKRVMAKFFNTPSLFKPFQRVRAEVDERVDARAQRRQTERERRDKNRARLPAKYQSAVDSARSRLSGWSGKIAGAVLLQGVYCSVYEVRQLLPLVNYAQVVVPSMIEGTDKLAGGNQVMAADDFELNQVTAVTESFTLDAERTIEELGEDNLDTEDIAQLRADDGKSIWSGKALNALANNDGGVGQEIEPGYKLAFAGELEGGPIASLFDENAIGDASCSAVAQAIGAIGGMALSFVPVVGWKARAATVGGQLLLVSAASKILTTIVLNHFSENAMEIFSGPQGGNLFAYGEMASNNLNATSMGGFAMSSTQTTQLIDQAEDREQREFANKSFLVRTFDMRDHRSLTARVYRSTNTTIDQGVSSIASMLNPVRVLSFVNRSFTQTARANTDTYDWGFPVYGIPLDILENDRYEDPYYNEEQVVGILDAGGRSADNLIDRARVCFGVSITNRSGEWIPLREEAVNPLEDEYKDADCDDLSDEDWIRTSLFVLDSSIVTTIDCYEGDSASCSDIGM